MRTSPPSTARRRTSSIGTDLGGLGQGISGLGAGNPPQPGAALAAFEHDWGTGLARAGHGIKALAAIARHTAALFAAADSQG